VFIFTVHAVTAALDYFITRLLDPSFLFVIAVDGKFPEVLAALELRWASAGSVFFLRPSPTIHWSSFSQILPPWMAVSALSNVSVAWFSFHSGDDVPVRGRAVVKRFLRHYRDRAEFFEVISNQTKRAADLFMNYGVCTSSNRLERVRNEIHRLFPDLSTFLRPSILTGPNWATVSGSLAARVLAVIRTEPELVLRIGFSDFADENFLQTVTHHIGVAPVSGCGFLRYTRWITGEPHPVWLTVKDLVDARQGFALFARKFPRHSKMMLEVLDRLVQNDTTMPEVLLGCPAREGNQTYG
jgi:hypothetical protein